MNVDRVYSRRIVSVPRSASLGDAAARMKAHQVGALLVTEDARAGSKGIGVVTDRDLVLHALAEGIGPAEASVDEVMTHGLATVASDASLHEAAEAMRASGVRRLGVTGADGALVGIVSMDDILEGLAAEFASLAQALRVERERELARQSDRAPVSA
jgi:CBS domain-containing protein